MKQFYVVPTATFFANIPDGAYHQLTCPDDPTRSLVILLSWRSDAAQDAWEALPGVTEILPEHMTLPVAPAVAAALRSHDVVPGMTHRAMFAALRKHWPCWRH